MDQTSEPITAYGLMFGRPVDATLREIDLAFRNVPERTLFQLAGLGTVLGTAFDMAFGGADMRTRAVAATAFGPIATELDSRGYQFPFHDDAILAAFNDWLASFHTGGREIGAIPTHRLVIMANHVGEALAWLGPDGHPVVIGPLQQAHMAVAAELGRRGVPLAQPAVITNGAIERASARPESLKAFIAYSHKDEDHRDRLVTHLSSLRTRGKISEWHDRKIVAGDEWQNVINRHFDDARVILLLISPDFMASAACQNEVSRALERHEARSAVVIPIIVRPTHTKDQPFTKLQMLPRDAKAVTKWKNRDNAWINVIDGIEAAIANR